MGILINTASVVRDYEMQFKSKSAPVKRHSAGKYKIFGNVFKRKNK